MALNQWFKFYGGEYLSDPKIASLTPQERSCWVTLLCLSSISSIPGTVEYLTVEALLQKSGIVWDPYEPDEWDRAKTVLDKFVRMKMVTKNEEGVIEILNWTKRQDTLMTAAERQAKYRENKKSNANVTERVTKVTLDKIREDKNTITLEDSLPSKEKEFVIEEESSAASRKAEARAEKIEEEGYDSRDVKGIRKEAEIKFSTKFPNPSAQESHIKKMLIAGFSGEQQLEEMNRLLSDPFWGESGVDFKTVSGQIGKAKRKKFNKVSVSEDIRL